MARAKTLTASHRDALILDYIKTGVSRAAMCRKSGLPDTAMLIGRSVFPMLLQAVHSKHAGPCQEMSHNAILESLRQAGVISDIEHATLREGASGLTEYGSSRSVGEMVNGLQLLLDVHRQESPSDRGSEKNATPKKQDESKRPREQSRFQRFAHAAAILVTLGAVR